MTTPRDPGRSIRGGETPRGGTDPAEPQGGGATVEERWTPEDRYVIERQPRLPRREPPAGWNPPPRRRRPVWASAALAALLGAILVALVVIAAVVLPGMTSPDGSPAASGSASSSLVAASASATPTPSPSGTAKPAATPLPSVLEVEVQPGDSLNAIADRYDTHPRSIAFWNRDRYPNLDPQSADYEPDQIQVGWKLVIYPGQTFAEPSASAAPSGSVPPGAAPSPSPSAP
jgi:hypothetical protein